jgi:hypothetical protein
MAIAHRFSCYQEIIFPKILRIKHMNQMYRMTLQGEEERQILQQYKEPELGNGKFMLPYIIQIY